MQERSINTIIIISSLLLVISIIGLINNINNIKTITGAATVESAISQVVLKKFFSISKSINLSLVNFGDIDIFIDNINATGNYENITNVSLYYVTVSTDSNVKVDFCVRGNAMTEPTTSDVIGIGNYTWTRSTYVNITNSSDPPEASFSVALNLVYQPAQTNVARGNNTYFRFFLDIPVNQPAGTYNNTIFFKGVSGGPC